MKKILVIIVCFFIPFIFIGCTGKIEKVINNNLAEFTTCAFEAESANFKINFRTGKREEPYIGDGVAHKLKEFGVLTVNVLNKTLTEHKMKFELNIDEKKFENDFLINPYDNSFVFDIETMVDNSSRIEVEIFYDSTSLKLLLKSVLNGDDLCADEIIKIASKELSPEIRSLIKNKKFNGEVYVRLINSSLISGSKSLWYFSIFTVDNKIIAIIINPSTGEVLAKKT